MHLKLPNTNSQETRCIITLENSLYNYNPVINTQGNSTKNYSFTHWRQFSTLHSNYFIPFFLTWTARSQRCDSLAWHVLTMILLFFNVCRCKLASTAVIQLSQKSRKIVTMLRGMRWGSTQWLNNQTNVFQLSVFVPWLWENIVNMLIAR